MTNLGRLEVARNGVDALGEPFQVGGHRRLAGSGAARGTVAPPVKLGAGLGGLLGEKDSGHNQQGAFVDGGADGGGQALDMLVEAPRHPGDMAFLAVAAIDDVGAAVDGDGDGGHGSAPQQALEAFDGGVEAGGDVAVDPFEGGAVAAQGVQFRRQVGAVAGGGLQAGDRLLQAPQRAVGSGMLLADGLLAQGLTLRVGGRQDTRPRRRPSTPRHLLPPQRMDRPRHIAVHGLDHARAALAAAQECRCPVVLTSSPEGAASLGAPLFARIIALARAEYPAAEAEAVLDCGDAPGLALAAMRCGVEAVRVRAAPEAMRRLADIAAQAGVRLLPAEDRPVLDLADIEDVPSACRAWLA